MRERVDVEPSLDIREAQPHEKSGLETILRALPEWFGIEAAIVEYMRDVEALQTFVAMDGERAVGFLALAFHNPFTAEVHVMGILPDYHRQGIGTALVKRAEEAAREAGCEYLEVKTLGPSHPDPYYARTRDFYMRCGFRPLEELADLWPGNPCQIMVKRL
jgi:GNAT superfamily N-acetyltransferase